MHHPDTREQMENPTPEPQPRRGWGDLPCPRCGEAATVSVDLDYLTCFRCDSCDAEFFRSEIEDLIAAWTPVLRWLDTAPVQE